MKKNFFVAENLMETFDVPAAHKGDWEFMLRGETLLKLAEDNPHFGVKVTIPKTDEFSVRDGDKVSFDMMYTVIVLKADAQKIIE